MNFNHMIGKGSVVSLIDNPENNIRLGGKPILIISNKEMRYGNYYGCAITSKDTMGIRCKLWNYVDGKSMETVDKSDVISTIQPYNMCMIREKDIEYIIGVLDTYIVDKVIEGIQYHLGLSNVIPKYYEEIHTQFFEINQTELLPDWITTYSLEKSKIIPHYTTGQTTTFNTTIYWPYNLLSTDTVNFLKTIKPMEFSTDINAYPIQLLALILARKIPIQVVSHLLGISRKEAAEIRNILESDTQYCVDRLFKSPPKILNMYHVIQLIRYTKDYQKGDYKNGLKVFSPLETEFRIIARENNLAVDGQHWKNNSIFYETYMDIKVES